MNLKSSIIALIISSGLVTTALMATPKKHIAFPGGKCWLYRVSFKDKNGTPFSLKHPDKYLSLKSIERRKRQHLPVDSTDLPISPKYVNDIKKKGYDIVSKSKWNNTAVVRLTDSTRVTELSHFPFVKKVHLLAISPDSVPVVHRYSLEKDTTRLDSASIYGDAFEQINTLNGIKLHEAGYTGQGMTIAIIDGGFMNADKIPLLQNVTVLGTRNFTYPSSRSVYDELDHGTAVLSCIGANQTGKMIGTAPKAAFWLLRSEYGATESEAEEDWWAAAAEFADSVGVDVVNSSLGYHDFDRQIGSHSYKELDGKTALISNTASMMASKGIILTNSAGNDGENSWKKISVPADADNILTVGALRHNNINAAFSSVGYAADGRVKPDVMAHGNPCTLVKGNGILSKGSGTSFSSPVICGLVACLWQALPQLTAQQIMQLVRQSADRYETPDNIFGYGIPDFWKAYNSGKQLIERKP